MLLLPVIMIFSKKHGHKLNHIHHHHHPHHEQDMAKRLFHLNPSDERR
jgi:hypothetical protein